METVFQLPHDFTNLRNGDHPPTLLIGSGLSLKLAPSLGELKKKCIEAEQELGICPPDADSIVAQTDMDAQDSLYIWADGVLDYLRLKGVPNPKLNLARALGLTTESSWHCGTRLGIQRTTPRHRVIARLAREKRWGSIWTFNWDCLIEAALESVGLKCGDADASQPWPTGYHTFVTREDYKHIGENSITLHKPHGCAEALRRAEECISLGDMPTAEAFSKRFLIGKNELSKICDASDPDHTSITAKMNAYFSGNPLICAGWSAQEPYFLEFLSGITDQLKTYPEQEDRLSIINPSSKPEYDELKDIFGVGGVPCLFEVKRQANEIFTSDWLFLWIQTVYGLEILLNRAENITVKTEISSLLKQVKIPGSFDFVAKWFDCFLPAWVRLCWRSGLVSTTLDNGQKVLPHRIRMEKRDEHIPWRRAGDRPELEAAGMILIATQHALAGWDMEKYPGAYWNPQDMALQIPVPAWQAPVEHNAIASLKPLLEEVRRNIAFIRKIALIPITLNNTQPAPNLLKHYKSLVGRFLPIAQFAAGDKIDIIDLEMLTGGNE